MMRSETVRALYILGVLILIDWSTRLITNAVRGAAPEVQASFVEAVREMRDKHKGDHAVTPR